MSDEELEEKGVLGATLGELREAFQQGRAGGDGGATSVVEHEAADVVSRAGREAESRGRGPGRPRKPVPETSAPQPGGLGDTLGGAVAAVATPLEVVVDGDGDGWVFDSDPKKRRRATPEEMAASRGAGMVRQAAQSAVPGQGVDGTRGSSPEGISQRIARSAGRMAARVAGRKPVKRQTTDVPELQLFEGADRPRSSPELVKKVKENRAAVARLVPRAIKDVVADRFRGIDDVVDAHTLEDAEYTAPHHLGFGRSVSDLTEDERPEFLRRLKNKLNMWLTPIESFKPRTDADSEQEVQDLIGVSMDRSPVFAEMVERHGLPKIFLYDDMPYDEMRGQTSAEQMGSVAGWHSRYHNTLGLNGLMFDTDPDLPDTLPNEFGFGGTITSMDRVLRHEMGHRIASDAEFGSGLNEPDPERRQAADELRSYFIEKMLLAKSGRRRISRAYELGGPEAAAAERDSLPEQERKDVESSMWMTTYGLSTIDEFYAELFANASSEDPEVRDSIPEEVRPMLVKMLGIDPWNMDATSRGDRMSS